MRFQPGRPARGGVVVARVLPVEHSTVRRRLKSSARYAIRADRFDGGNVSASIAKWRLQIGQHHFESLRTMFDFSVLKRAFQGLQSRRASIRTEIEELQRQRGALLNAPAGKDEVKALLAGWVQQAGAGYTGEMQSAVEQMARNHTSMRNPLRLQSLATLGAIEGGSGAAESKQLAQAICAVFGEGIRTTLCKAVDDMTWPANALSSAQRARDLDAIDDRIFKLQTEEQEINNQAAEAGLRLE
jgi:hypothetical protein